MPQQARHFSYEPLQASAPPDPKAPEQIVARAQAEADQIREQARAEGMQQGYDAGCEQGVEAARTAAEALGKTLEEMHQTRERMLDALEQDAVGLALALAAKILAGALEAQPERVLDVVRGALRHIAERRSITILVDPADMEIVNAAIGELSAKAGGIEHCEVHADRRVGRGGAIVRTSEGEVDACVDTQLEQAREVIAAELGTLVGAR
ncbi:MAG TPA: FliH/SctL family protein [Solirubrobacteraceae bacterium]